MTLSKLANWTKLSIFTPRVLVSNTLIALNDYFRSDVERTEGVLTNRAQAYIKLKKFKEALADSETALLLNANFAKARVSGWCQILCP